MDVEKTQYRIYKIVCRETGEVYYGKTTKTMKERLRKHKSNIHCDRPCTSKQIIERNNYYIEQIDTAFNKEESIKLERYYIENFDCVNKIISGRTQKEWYKATEEVRKQKRKEYDERNKERQKEWYKATEEVRTEKRKEYYENNKEKYKEYRETNREKTIQYLRDYREKNRDKILEKDKERYQNRKEQIAEKQKEVYTCDCGTILTKGSKSNHMKSKKHQNYFSSFSACSRLT